ncbi:MAG: hypothetical protein JOZ38_12755 [Candidatus Eremiobacteraeota bacterium]|nr:hypothetical protein [Candidatus Eremiobacteraeota bacterium]
MVSLATSHAFLRAIAGARRIDLVAYALQPGPTMHALERAAERGAAVSVRIEAHPYRDKRGRCARAARRAIAELRAHGVHAELWKSDPRHGIPALHAKEAVVDGVAYLDDRNWVVRDDAQTIVRDDNLADPRIRENKRAALRAEVEMIDAVRRGSIRVVTESFGPGPVCDALARACSRGVRVELLIAAADRNARTERCARSLRSAGATVRAGDANEKFAVSGDSIWIGSANATSPSSQLDWGLRFHDASIAGALQKRFDAEWNSVL